MGNLEKEKRREKIARLMSAAALIHDMRNAVSDGSRKMADRRYPWWNLKRYFARFAADFLFDFVCSQAGWRAWMDCYEKLRKEKLI